MSGEIPAGFDLHAAGSALALRGAWPQAADLFRRAVSEDPQDPVKRHALAVSLLGAGNYREGFSLYAGRSDIPMLNIRRPQPQWPEWRGEPVAGKHILLFPEQGYGDQIQFARYAAELRRRGAEVTLFCAPALTSLFAGLGVRALTASGAVEFPEPDLWSLLGDLPARLGVTLETLDGAPYLQASARPSSDRVGIVRRGNPDHPNDANRSLPDDLVLPFEGLSLDPAATGAKDFRETAEIIQGLEAVVSVDTAIAHLSGALGKPCLLLLPAIGCDWRWMARRQDSPWYDSLRLVRQAEPGRWEAPLAEAADWLTKRLG